MSATALVQKIAALPASEQAKVEIFVDSLAALATSDEVSPREHFDRARKVLEGLHGKVDISSSIREVRDSQ